jgi:DNA polymerase epsilon subunit 3
VQTCTSIFVSLTHQQQVHGMLLTAAHRPQPQQVFISFITATANDVCKEKKRATINADDVFQALEDLEFGDLLPALKESFEGGCAVGRPGAHLAACVECHCLVWPLGRSCCRLHHTTPAPANCLGCQTASLAASQRPLCLLCCSLQSQQQRKEGEESRGYPQAQVRGAGSSSSSWWWGGRSCSSRWPGTC